MRARGKDEGEVEGEGEVESEGEGEVASEGESEGEGEGNDDGEDNEDAARGIQRKETSQRTQIPLVIRRLMSRADT